MMGKCANQIHQQAMFQKLFPKKVVKNRHKLQVYKVLISIGLHCQNSDRQ